MRITGPSRHRVELRRELSRWDLSAIGVNQVIGGAVFLVPAALVGYLGAWSWVAVVGAILYVTARRTP